VIGAGLDVRFEPGHGLGRDVGGTGFNGIADALGDLRGMV
jgi:hypothetical protein